MSGFFRFVALLVLLGLIAVVGINVYNAGVSAGIASDVGKAIASGAPVPVGYYPGPYIAHPWGNGFGFGEFLFGIFILFLFFGLVRAAFGFGRWGGHRGGGYGKWGGRHGGWHDYMDEWHRERHGEATPAPTVPTPDKS